MAKLDAKNELLKDSILLMAKKVVKMYEMQLNL